MPTEYTPLKRFLELEDDVLANQGVSFDDLELYGEIVMEATSRKDSDFKVDMMACEESLKNMEECSLHIRKYDEEEKIEWKCSKCGRNGVITEYLDSEYDAKSELFLESIPDDVGDDVPPPTVFIEMPEDMYDWFMQAPYEFPEGFRETIQETVLYADGLYFWEAPFALTKSLSMEMKHQMDKLDQQDQDQANKFMDLIEQEAMRWISDVFLYYAAGKISDSEIGEYFAGFEDPNQPINDLKEYKENFLKDAEAQGVTPEQLIEQIKSENPLNNSDEPSEDLADLNYQQFNVLVFSDWSDDTPGLYLHTDNIDKKQLEAMPVIHNVRLLSQLVSNKNGLPLTKNGNLKQKDVATLLDNGKWPQGYVKDVKKFNKTINELDAFEIHELRLVCQLAKIFRVYKGKLITVKKNQNLLKQDKVSELYSRLLTAWFREYNFAYRMGYEDVLQHFQQHIPFYLYKFSKMPDHQSLEQIGKEIVFPTPEWSFFDPDEIESSRLRYRGRFLETFMFRVLKYFGLVEIDKSKSDKESLLAENEDIFISKTPLFHKVIRFNLDG